MGKKKVKVKVKEFKSDLHKMISEYKEGITVICFYYDDEAESENYYNDISKFIHRLSEKYDKKVQIYCKRQRGIIKAVIDFNISGIDRKEIMDLWDKGSCKIERSQKTARGNTIDLILNYINIVE